MKILAFSDLHCDVVAAQKIVEESVSAEIVIGAGDFGAKGKEAEAVLETLSKIAVPLIIVSGNHDILADLETICAEWPHVHLLHGSAVEIAGQTFYGLGSEVPPSSDHEWNQTLSEEEAADLLSACPDDAVLVTHSPPYGHCDLQRDGNLEGSRAILNVLETKTIKLNLCGHIHNAWGMVSEVNGCGVFNLGPTVNWFEIE